VPDINVRAVSSKANLYRRFYASAYTIIKTWSTNEPVDPVPDSSGKLDEERRHRRAFWRDVAFDWSSTLPERVHTGDGVSVPPRAVVTHLGQRRTKSCFEVECGSAARMSAAERSRQFHLVLLLA